jgi:hypothetical protein
MYRPCLPEGENLNRIRFSPPSYYIIVIYTKSVPLRLFTFLKLVRSQMFQMILIKQQTSTPEQKILKIFISEHPCCKEMVLTLYSVDKVLVYSRKRDPSRAIRSLIADHCLHFSVHPLPPLSSTQVSVCRGQLPLSAGRSGV